MNGGGYVPEFGGRVQEKKGGGGGKKCAAKKGKGCNSQADRGKLLNTSLSLQYVRDRKKRFSWGTHDEKEHREF